MAVGRRLPRFQREADQGSLRVYAQGGWLILQYFVEIPHAGEAYATRGPVDVR
jgi:hypothetical protein